MWKSKFYGAFVLNLRVVLHAIDATPARWRGNAGSSPLDRARTVASSPRNDLLKNCRVHPTHWLISSQVVALCLVLCFESPKVISTPQPLLRSAALVFSFATTVFLAADGVLSKIVSASVAINVAFALSILATVGVVALLWWMRTGRSKEQAEFELSCRELPVPNPLAASLGSPSLTRRAVDTNVAPAP